jgi:hypothetical protein
VNYPEIAHWRRSHRKLFSVHPIAITSSTIPGGGFRNLFRGRILNRFTAADVFGATKLWNRSQTSI